MEKQLPSRIDFKKYEQVRVSGTTNMFDVNMVSQLSGLDIYTIKLVMNHYSELKEKYQK